MGATTAAATITIRTDLAPEVGNGDVSEGIGLRPYRHLGNIHRGRHRGEVLRRRAVYSEGISVPQKPIPCALHNRLRFPFAAFFQGRLDTKLIDRVSRAEGGFRQHGMYRGIDGLRRHSPDRDPEPRGGGGFLDRGTPVGCRESIPAMRRREFISDGDQIIELILGECFRAAVARFAFVDRDLLKQLLKSRSRSDFRPAR